MKSVLFVLFICCSVLVFGQTKDSLNNSVKSNVPAYLTLRVSPLALLRPETAMLPFSIEIRNKLIDFEYEHGFRTKDFLFNWNHNKSNIKSFRSQFNLKFYFKNEYLGLNFSYLPLKFSKENSRYMREGIRYSYDLANVSIDRFDFRLIYVRTIANIKPFVVDFTLDLGARNRVINYLTVVEEQESKENIWDELIVPRENRVGNKVVPSV